MQGDYREGNGDIKKMIESSTENKKQPEAKVELLAPAGNYEAFLGAVNAGADAVYLGGEKFGARAYAENFTTEEICRAIHVAHVMGRRIYLTVNTLIKDDEFEDLIPYLRPFYESGLDGVIVQDIGVLTQIRNYFPELALHASTQMTLTGPEGCAFLKEHGVERIVPARELSLEEVRRIKKQTGLEIECFVHGAMCYCYSGQCLFSSVLGGRSGNRGRCAQPCRLPYQICDGAGKTVSPDTAFPLSLKDMCTISYLPQLIEAGIDSFKIEGRMKKAEYAAGVTALYRKYIDLYYEKGPEAYQVSKEDLDKLKSLYIRSEIQTGYYERKNGREMITLHRPNYAGSDESLLAQIRAKYLHEPDKLAVSMKVTLDKGKPAILQITGDSLFVNRETLTRFDKDSERMHGIEEECACGKIDVSVEGEIVEAAQKAPLRAEDIRKRLLKTGNSCVFVTTCEICMTEDIFLPVRALNELRRAGVEAYERQYILRQGMNTGRKTNRNTPTGSVNHTESVDGRPLEMQFIKEQPSEQKRIANRTETMHAASVDILITTSEQFAVALQFPCRRIYIDSDLYVMQHERILGYMTEQKARYAEAATTGDAPEYYLALPYILRAGDGAYMEQLIRFLDQEHTAADSDAGGRLIGGFLVRNYEEAAFVRKLADSYDIVPDAGLYCFNAESVRFWAHYCREYTLPWELNRKEAGKLADHAMRNGMRTAMIIYGRIPMMITANCIRKTAKQCHEIYQTEPNPQTMPIQRSRLQLKDRYGVIFPVEINCRHCYNIIYNSVPFSLHQQENVVKRIGVDVRRYDFTTETADECRRILTVGQSVDESYTTGHLKRGVE